jgi:hypothetical protein
MTEGAMASPVVAQVVSECYATPPGAEIEWIVPCQIRRNRKSRCSDTVAQGLDVVVTDAAVITLRDA